MYSSFEEVSHVDWGAYCGLYFSVGAVRMVT